MASRAGLRICGKRGHPEVRDAYIRYSVWLRLHYEFPIRVPVYLLPNESVVTMSGDRCPASFFAPFDLTVEPYIRVATGDYPAWKARHGRDNAIAAWLKSLSHEVIHYQQWISTGDTTEKGVVRAASRMVDRYALTVDHP